MGVESSQIDHNCVYATCLDLEFFAVFSSIEEASVVYSPHRSRMNNVVLVENRRHEFRIGNEVLSSMN